jgi:ribosomal-protein-alanine N-acetyltransferase
MRALDVRRVSLLGIRDWIEPIAAQLGFEHNDDIVTLRRSSAQLPDFRIPRDLTIRPTELEDLPTITRVDHAAFAPPWQLSLRELRQADRISASCTVAVRDGQIIGYQLTTLYFDGAHLARLAVLPQAQGSGVGAALVYDLLARFWRRQVHSITVNTQSSNQRSQRLYIRLGFHHNGFNLPVWTAAV